MQPTYPPDALGSLAAAGVTHLEIWCVALPCTGRTLVQIDRLIADHGADMRLVMLARRARCRECGARGAHVQPDSNPRATRLEP